MIKKWLAALILSTSATAAYAIGEAEATSAGCVDAEIISGKLITDICWDCIFPLRIAGIPISMGGDEPPEGSVDIPLCYCQDDLGVPRPGFTTSMWEPARLIEFQRIPGCASVLGGIRFPVDRLRIGNHQARQGDGAEATYMHAHYYSFPLLDIMELFTESTCNADGYMDLDLLYLSELDPTWNNSSLAFFVNPEAAAVANPLAVTACSADAASSTAGKPMDSLWWCAGTLGSIYPLAGYQYENFGIVRATSKLKIKFMAALHRRGLEWETIGEANMCGGGIAPTMPKTQYKFTLLHPLPEANDAHVMGESDLIWGNGRTIPGVGEDLIYTIWRWTDCCNVY